MGENGKLENAAGTPGYKAPELMTLGVAGVIGVGRSARVTNSCDLYGDYFKKGTAVEIIKSARESDFGNEWEVRCQKTNKTCIINEEDLEDTEEVDATYLGAPVDVWNFGFCLWSMLVNPKYRKESNNPFEPAEWHDDKDEKWWKEEKKRTTQDKMQRSIWSSISKPDRNEHPGSEAVRSLPSSR